MSNNTDATIVKFNSLIEKPGVSKQVRGLALEIARHSVADAIDYLELVTEVSAKVEETMGEWNALRAERNAITRRLMTVDRALEALEDHQDAAIQEFYKRCQARHGEDAKPLMSSYRQAQKYLPY